MRFPRILFSILFLVLLSVRIRAQAGETPEAEMQRQGFGQRFFQRRELCWVVHLVLRGVRDFTPRTDFPAHAAALAKKLPYSRTLPN